MNELYEKLSETDYIAGLRRQITQSQETRSMVAFAQHDMWEEINQQFSHFIIYYAEQEGQYSQMDEEQKKPGKYQRQIPEQTFNGLMRNHDTYMASTYEGLKQQNPDTFTMDQQSFMKAEYEKISREIEQASGKMRFEADPQTYSYPRKGPNNKVKEIDLRIWDNLFSESLKVLNRWD
jgi:FAT domain